MSFDPEIVPEVVWRAWSQRRLGKAPPVLVYQMGKVGSSSVHASLSAQYPGVTLHLHNFSPESPERLVRLVHDWAMTEKKPVRVISMTREPIARNISAFFENFQRDTGFQVKGSNLPQPELQRLFLEKCRHDVPLNWFDRHVQAKFGIDVFATHFPDSGICHYENASVAMLIMRCEIPDAKKENAVRAFLGIPEFKLVNKNIGEQKDYGDIYRKFKSQLRLPTDYINRMCDSKYFNHFYGREFVEETRRKWVRLATEAVAG